VRKGGQHKHDRDKNYKPKCQIIVAGLGFFYVLWCIT